MAVFAPKKALEVNGQEIYPLTHAKQVIMDDGNRLNDKLIEIENNISNTDITKPLIGTTSEITPTQVLDAVLACRDVAITHTDSTYGEMVFTHFTCPVDVGFIISTTVFSADNYSFISTSLSGVLTSNNWIFNVDMLPKKDSIPTALKNPNALTIDSTTYDGSTAVDMTSTINELIDTKIAEITNAEEVAF